MRRAGWFAAAAAAASLVGGSVTAAPAPIVFFDIAGPDLASHAAFYKAVFGWEAGPTGALTAPTVSPLPSKLRVEPPTLGPTAERVLYVGVPDITATLEVVKAHGGQVVLGRTIAPGVVILALFKDPAGNRMGLVELDAAGKPVVPPAK